MENQGPARGRFLTLGKSVADDGIAAGIAFMRLVAHDAEATARFRNEALTLMDNNMNGPVR